MATPLKTLVVGCGSIGQRHARLLADRDDVAVALCDRDPKQLAAARKVADAVETHADYKTAIAQKPDAVFVCTPNRYHKRVAVAALEAGADVFCEKPLAHTFEAGRAIAVAAAKAKRVVHVGYLLRFHPMVQRMQQIVESGAIGNLVSGRAMVGTYFTLQAARSDYRLDEPNALVFDYSHELDLLGLFFGAPKHVVATKAHLGDLEIKPDPNLFSIIVRFKSGAVASVHMDYIQQPQRRSLELYGDRGHLFADFIDGQVRHYEHDREGYHSYPCTLGRDDMFRAQLDAFLRAVRTTREAPVSVRDALRALKMAEAAVASAARKQWVRIR